MSTITGKLRNGGIVLDGPLPDWVEESDVIVQKPDTATDAIDINGDSPEAIAAWIAWYDDFLALPKSEGAADELEMILDTRKAEQKELWKGQGEPRFASHLCNSDTTFEHHEK